MRCRFLSLGLVALALASLFSLTAAAQGNGKIQRVLLISIDGMHSLDFANCAKGVPIYGNQTYCPHLAALSSTGVHYLQALTSKPSDSFPGLVAQITGGTPRSAGVFYDVTYDRALSPPAKTTPYGIVGGAKLCPSVIGTQVGFDEEIDYNYLELDSGKTDGSSGSTESIPTTCRAIRRMAARPCIRTLSFAITRFSTWRKCGCYTAWSDKHPSYDFTNGPSGDGVVICGRRRSTRFRWRFLRYKVALRCPTRGLPSPPMRGPTASRTFAATTSTKCRRF